MVSDTQGPAIPDPAEATDGSELGEEAGDESLPGTVGFPPTSPAGVGPAGSIADLDRRDSVGQRSEREEPEGWSTPREPVVLLDPNASGEPDDESEMVAEEVPPVGLISPEEAAVHVESE
jgi:hypothetical protein